MREDLKNQSVEVIYVMELDDQLLVTLEHIPELSLWNKILLLEKLDLRWQITHIGMGERGHEIREHSICVVEPINHQFKLEKGMILVCEEANQGRFSH